MLSRSHDFSSSLLSSSDASSCKMPPVPASPRDSDAHFTKNSQDNMLRCCPMGHALSKERNHEAHLRCDGVCGTAVVLDAWLWSCAKCDFDLCVTCAHQPEAPAQGLPPSASTAGMEAADRYISAEGELDDVKRELWDTWGLSPERAAKRAKETLGSKHRNFAKSKGQRKGGTDSGTDDEPKRKSPRKSGPATDFTLDDFTPTPAQLASLRPPPPYAEEALRSAPLVEPISGLPLSLEPLPALPPALDDPVLVASLRTKRAWLSSLFELEISRELRDQSATQCPCPAIYDEEARRARVRLCVARFKEARLDLIASEQLQLGL